MSKHTQGPWAVQIDRSDPDSWHPDITTVNISAPTGWVANYDASAEEYGSEEDVEANARLIAAAPDLLEACRRLLVCMSLAGWENDDSAISARSAIAKATGEDQ